MTLRLPEALEEELAELFASGLRAADYDGLVEQYPLHGAAIRECVARAEAIFAELDAGDEPPPRRLGRFVLCGILGRGGMGVVFRAFDPRLGREVAVKSIRPELIDQPQARQRFEREGRVLSRLHHENLGQVFDVGEIERSPYMVMRLVRGRSLGAEIDAARALGSMIALGDLASLITAIERIARALHHAHRHDVVHRDVKPDNIVFDADGRPVLTDFGLAIDVQAMSTLTGGLLVGTPAYMAPEQIDGRTADARTDVYGLGATLYECLTLQPPFAAATLHELSQAILQRAPQPIRAINPAVPRDLAILVEVALAKSPEHRYRSAEEFADDLVRVREHRPIRARPPGWTVRLRQWVRRNPLPAASLALTSTAAFLAFAALGAARASEARYDLLAIDARLDQAVAAERALYPARPERASLMESWLENEAEPLLAEAPKVERTLGSLRSTASLTRAITATPPDGAAPWSPEYSLRVTLGELNNGRQELVRATSAGHVRRSIEANIRQLEVRRDQLLEQIGTTESFVLTDPNEQFLHDRLTALHDRLTAFESLVARVRERLQWARSVQGRSITDARDAWQEAIDAIEGSDGTHASRLYRHLPLEPQIGLVPIGMDPLSQLWEFAHLRSGSTPDRDPDSCELRLEHDSAIVFVLIPGGRAETGAQGDDPSLPFYDPAFEVGEELRSVELEPFFLSKHEITQAQWVRLGDGTNPARHRLDQNGDEIGPRNPVESVSWDDASLVLSQHALELPTEAQWEYACRAGTSTPWSCGADPRALSEAANLVDRTGPATPTWGPKEPWSDGHYAHAAVGSFAPNAFGLHDMHGNVEEWCADFYAPRDRITSGTGLLQPSGSQMRIVRGGSYQRGRERARAAKRSCDSPGVRTDERGVRAARRIE